jgi:hypothetical protein
MQYRWGNAIDGFDMPIKVTIAGKTQWLSPTSQWEKMSLEVKNSQVKVDANFYVNTMNVLGD